MVVSRLFYTILSAGMCFGIGLMMLLEGMTGKSNIIQAWCGACFIISIGGYFLIKVLRRLKPKWRMRVYQMPDERRDS